MIHPDFKGPGGRGQILAAANSGGAKILPDRLQRRLTIADDFVQLDVSARELAVFRKREVRYFGHGEKILYSAAVIHRNLLYCATFFASLRPPAHSSEQLSQPPGRPASMPFIWELVRFRWAC